MPYNMQVLLLKAEEAEEFYQLQMQEKDKEIDTLSKQQKILQRKWDEAYDIQQELENALEEYENNTRRWEEQLKSTSRKLQECQQKYSHSEKSRKELETKTSKLELEKCKISEKWIKLSTKNKNDDKLRTKLKEMESSCSK